MNIFDSQAFNLPYPALWGAVLPKFRTVGAIPPNPEQQETRPHNLPPVEQTRIEIEKIFVHERFRNYRHDIGEQATGGCCHNEQRLI